MHYRIVTIEKREKKRKEKRRIEENKKRKEIIKYPVGN